MYVLLHNNKSRKGCFFYRRTLHGASAVQKAVSSEKSCDNSCAQFGYNKEFSQFRVGYKSIVKLGET